MTTTRLLLGTAAALTAATAAAQSSNFTIYGRVDMALSYQSRIFVNGQVTNRTERALQSGGSNGSRLGFRGVEDLGNGQRAVFVMESGFQADTGVFGQGGRAWGRQVYVGLEGPWGRFTAGRQYTPWFDVLSTSDPFGNNLVGNSGNLEHADARADNALVYTTPGFGGFSAQAMLALGNRAGSGKAGSQANLALRWRDGPLWLGAAYGQAYNAVEAPANSGRFTSNTTGRFAMLGASYDFGVVKAFANVVHLSNLNPVFQAAPQVVDGAKGSSWLVGASAPVGEGSVMASLVSLNDQRALDRDARMLAVGYNHPLSKRTTLYTAFARVINRHGGTLTANTPSYPGLGEAQLQAGISHVF